MDKIDFIKSVVQFRTVKGESLNIPPSLPEADREHNSPRIIYHSNGDIKAIYIHQSMIKKIVSKGTRLDYCAKKVYETDLMKNYTTKPTIPMSLGIYMESGMLNNGVLRKKDRDIILPKGRAGAKSVLVERTEEQIFRFKHEVVPQTEMIVIPYDQPKSNVWRRFTIQWEDEYIRKTHDIDVFIELEVDLISPFHYKDDQGARLDYDEVIIDIKLTKDRYERRGEFCWGRVEDMDHIQAFTYSFILEKPFMYMVFDIKKDHRGWRPIPVNTNLNHPIPLMANEAKNRLAEFHQTIRMIVAEIAHNHKTGWVTNNIYTNCQYCPLLKCPDRNRIQEA